MLNGLRMNKGKLIGVRQIQEFACMVEFVSRFTNLRFIPVILAHDCLKTPLRTKAPICPVSNALLEAAEKVLELVRPLIEFR